VIKARLTFCRRTCGGERCSGERWMATWASLPVKRLSFRFRRALHRALHLARFLAIRPQPSSSPPIALAMSSIKVAIFVSSCSVSRLICRSRSARLSAAVAIRFCVIRTMRQEYRFDRCDYCQDHKGIIPSWHAWNQAKIGHDPKSKQRKMNIDKQHASGESSNGISYSRLPRST
jgi:hypothetical protein